MKGNYDPIARYYDRLNRLLLGRSVADVQTLLCGLIPAGAKVLLVGGGSGWILEAIAKIHPSGLEIKYADASGKMIALARKRVCGTNAVHYIHAAIQDVRLDGQYDVVFTPFLFDNFGDATAVEVFACLHETLQPGGLWLYCDFTPTERHWQHGLLRLMYLFFRLLCGIEARKLPDMDGLFGKYAYQPEQQNTLMQGFITGTAYRRGSGNEAI